MHLTRPEERMLAGEYGYAAQKAMEILVTLGKIYGAERMIEIRSAQISGVSYSNLGEEGLEFLLKLAEDGRVKVPTTLNPCGMDLEEWREMGIPEDFAEKQLRVIETYRRLGVEPTLTCTPYLAGNMPEFGDHVAWSESSAVIYVNSVIGARTNREGGPSALAAAIAGRTPLYGLHLDDARRPTIIVRAPRISGELDASALGYRVGRIIMSGVPLFTGLGAVSRDQLKALGAGLASSGGIALFHVEDATPEAHKYSREHVEDVIEITENDLREEVEMLGEGFDDPDLIFVGCPHASIEELTEIYLLLGGRRVSRRFWVFASRAVRAQAERIGLLAKLEGLDVRVYRDTCPVVTPLKRLGFKNVLTNSMKAAYYLRNLHGVRVRLKHLQGLVEDAVR
jgi:predicted aconitase